jgi:hypothetical protein
VLVRLLKFKSELGAAPGKEEKIKRETGDIPGEARRWLGRRQDQRA